MLDETSPSQIPPGFKLRHTLRGIGASSLPWRGRRTGGLSPPRAATESSVSGRWNGGVWVSAKVKEDIDTVRAAKHQQLKWTEHPDEELKGFPNCTLWSVA